MKTPNFKGKKGITLAALVITIIVLLIIATITITTLSGNNGIVETTVTAKEESEIKSELKVVDLASNQAKNKNRYGDVTGEELVKALKNNAGADQTEVEYYEKGSLYFVTFKKSKRVYEVTTAGYAKYVGKPEDAVVLFGKPKSSITPKKTIEVNVMTKTLLENNIEEIEYVWNQSEDKEPSDSEFSANAPKTLENVENEQTEKDTNVTLSEVPDGEYYLWVKVKNKGKVSIEHLGPYIIGEVSFELAVDPNGGTWMESSEVKKIKQKVGTKLTLDEPTPPANYVVTFKTEVGTVSKDKEISTVSFSKWDLKGAGTLEDNEYTFGKGKATATAIYTNSAIILPEATREGHDFDGWYDKDGNKVGEPNDEYTPSGSEELEAHWSPKSYILAFDYKTNGGTKGPDETQSVVYGRTVILSTITAEKENGYQFIGWNKNANDRTALDEIIMGAQNEKVYALFKKDIRLTFKDIKGDKYSNPDPVTIYNNDKGTATAPQISEYNGWDPLYWTTSIEADASKTVDNKGSISNITDPATYYARYKKNITIEFDLNGGKGTKPENAPGEVNVSTSDITKPKPATINMPEIESGKEPKKDGYVFNGWNTAEDGKGTHYDIDGTGSFVDSTTLYAEWTEKKATKLTLNKETATITYGDTTTIIATLEPADLINKNVNWTTSDATICNISKTTSVSGEEITLTANKVGTATITATAADGSGKTASCIVTVVAKKIAVPTAKTNLIYNGENQTGVEQKSEYNVTDGTKIDAGTYSAKAVLKDKTNTTWNDGTTTDKTIEWSIAKKDITVEWKEQNSWVYDGNAHKPEVNTPVNGAKDEKIHLIVEGEKVNVGNDYTATAKISSVEGGQENKNNYNLKETTKKFSIREAVILGKVTIKGKNTYGETLTANVTELDPSDATLKYQWFANDTESTTGGTKLTEPQDSNTYTIGKGLVGKYIYVVVTATKPNFNSATFEDLTDDENNTTETVSAKEIAAPTAKTGLIYNGQNQTGVENGSGYTVTDGTKKDAGNYTANVELEDKENTIWNDGTTDDKSMPWSIAKKAITVKADNKTKAYGENVPELTATFGETGVQGETLKTSGQLKTTAEKTSNVGTYPITQGTLQLTDNGSFKASNYTINFTNGTLTITKIDNTLNVTAKNLTYNTQEQELVNQTGLQGDIYYSVGTKLTSDNYTTEGTKNTIPSRTNAGDYKVYYYAPGNNNYNAKSDSVDVTIEKYSLENAIIAEIAPQVHTGSAITPEPEVKVNIPSEQNKTTIVKGTDFDYSYSNNTEVGTATITITGKGNYKDSKSITFQIIDKTPVVTNVTGYTGTYDGEEHTFNFEVSNPTSGCTVYYKEGTTPLTPSNYTQGTSQDKPTRTDAGTTTVQWYVHTENQFYADTNGSVTITINPKPIEVRAENKTKKYGEENPALTAVVGETGIQGETAKITGTPSTTAGKTSDVGVYVIGKGEVKLTNNDSFKANNYTIDFKNGTLTITQAENTLKVNANTLTYNTLEQELVNQTGAQGNVYYSIGTELTSSNYTTVTPNVIPKGTNAGNYRVYYYTPGTNNYAPTYGYVDVTINKYDLSKANMTQGDLDYTGSKLTPTPAVTVNIPSEQNKTPLTAGTEFTYSYGANTNAGTNAGSVTITAKDNTNYTGSKTVNFNINKIANTLKVNANTLTYNTLEQELVTESDKQGDVYYSIGTELTASNYTTGSKNVIPKRTNAGSYKVYYYTPGNDNYNEASGNVEATIEKYSLEYAEIASISAQIYNGVAITPEPQVKVNIPSSENKTTLVKGRDFDYSYTNNNAVGTATVTVTGKGNYKNSKSRTFQIIDKTPITLKEDESYTGTYDGQEHTFKLTVQEPAGCTIYYKEGTEALNENNYTSGTTNKPTRKDVGTTTVQWYIKAPNSSYADLNGNSTITVNTRTINVTADSKSKKYGQDNPELTATVGATGVQGETGNITGTPTTTAGKDSNVGNYPITRGEVNLVDNGTFKASNYLINFVNGTLTITAEDNPVVVNPRTLTYNTLAQSLVTVENVEGDIYYSVGTELTSSNYTTAGTKTTIPTRTDAGTYTVYYYVTGNNNYSAKSGNVKVTIAKYDISKTENSNIATIGAMNYTGNQLKPTPAVTVNIPSTTNKTTLTAGTHFEYSYGANVNAGTNAGSVTITAKDNTNYTGSRTVNFTINKISNTLEVSGKSLTYNTLAQELVEQTKEQGNVYYSIGTALNSSNYTTVTPNVFPKATDAGTYTIYFYTPGNTNYNSTSGHVETTIAKYDISSAENSNIAQIPAMSYTGNQLKPTPAVTVNIPSKQNKTTLTAGTHFEYSYGANVNAGTNAGSVTITAKDNTNYTGSRTVNFTINNIGNPVVVSPRTLTYNTLAQQLVTVENVEGDIYYSVGTELTEDNYENDGATTIPSRTDANTYKVYYYVTGNNNYSAKSGSVNVTIAKYDISREENSNIAQIPAMNYTGSQLTPTPEVKVNIPSTTNKTTLTAGTHFEYSYGANVNAGENAGSVTITAKQNTNYTGSRTVNFTINKIANPVNVTPRTLTYNASAQVLVNETGVQGDIYYSVGTELNSSNYTNTSVSTRTTKPSRTDAGTYTVYFYAPGNTNYNEKSGHVDVTIAKYDISKEGNATIATVGTKTYTGSAITPTPDVSVPIPSGTTTVLVNNTDFTYGYENNINVGTATIKVIAKDDSNYTGTKTTTFIIDAKKEIKVTSNNYTGNYDGQAHTFTLDVTEPSGCKIYYKVGTTPLTASNYQNGTTETKPTRTDAGTTTVQWYIHTTNATYNDLAGSNTIIINSIPATKPTVTAYTGTYDGASHGVTVTGGSGGTIQYSSNNNDWSEAAPTYKDFTDGAKTVYVKVAGDANHSDSEVVTSSITINKKQINVTADNKTKKYGENNPTLTVTIGATGVQGETAKITGTPSTTAGKTSDVGTYVIGQNGISLIDNGNFKANNYAMNFINGTLTITKADNTLNVTGKTLTYNTLAQVLASETNKQGDVYYSIETELTASNYTTVTPNVIPTGINAKDYVVYYYTPGTNNYAPKSGSVDSSIGKYNLSQANMTQGALDYTGSKLKPTPTVTVNIPSEQNKTPLTAGTEFTYSYGANTNAGTNAGSVTITAKDNTNYTGSKTVNFNINKIANTLEVNANTLTYNTLEQELVNETGLQGDIYYSVGTPLTSSNYTQTGTKTTRPKRTNADTYTVYYYAPGNNNYNEAIGNVEATIEKYSLNNADIASISAQIYNGVAITPEPEVKVNIPSAQNKTTLVKGRDFDYSYTNNNAVGTATVTVTGKGNYKDSKSKTFQIIDKTPITVDETNYTGTYDGQTHTFELNITDPTSGYTVHYKEGTEPLNESNYTNGTTTTKPTRKDVGTTTVQWYIHTTNPAYADLSGSSTITVNARTINVTADNKSKKYGQDNPELTATVGATGVQGETGNITGTPTTTAGKNSNVGSYPITRGEVNLVDNGTFKASNYSINFVNGTLTITAEENPVVVSPRTLTYNTLAQGLVTVENVEGDIYYSVGTELTSSNYTTAGTKTTIPTRTDAGTYTVYYYVTGNNNYSAKSGSVEVPIAKYNLNQANMTQGAMNYTGNQLKPTPGVTVNIPSTTNKTTLTAGTHFEYSYGANTNAGTNAGSVTITAKQNTNYTGSKTVNFTINKIANPVNVTPRTLTYNASAQVLVNETGLQGDIYYSVGTPLNSSNYTNTSVSTKTTKPSRTDAGTYTVYFYAPGNNNYESKSGHVDVTIAKYDISGQGKATIATVGAKTYTGSAITPTPDVSVPIPSGTTTVLVNNTDFTYGYENNINVGTATIKVIAKDDSNYTGTKTTTFVIDAKKEIKVTSNNYTGNYDGQAYTFTLNVTEPSGCTVYYKEGTTPLTASNYKQGTTETKPTRTNAGTTTVQWYIESSDPTYNDLAGSNTITINKIPATKPTVTAYTGTYDGASHGVTVTGGSGGTVQYSTNNNDWSATAPTYKDFTDGAKTVYVKVAGDANHSDSEVVTSSITINKKQINVTANDKTKKYGENNPTFTVTIGETGVQGETGAIAGTPYTDAEKTSDVGAYPIEKGNVELVNNNNFKADNYAMNFIIGTLTITKANGSGSVTMDGWTYGETAKNPVATSATNGTNNVTFEYKVSTAADSTYNATKPSNAGTYTVRATFAATGNYNAVTATDNFTISKRNITAKAGNSSKVYDGTALTNTTTGSITSGSLVSGQTATYSNSGTITNVGSVTNTLNTVTIKSGNTDVTANYNITKTNGTLTVTARSITVTADNKTRAYGEANPTFTVTIGATGVTGETGAKTGSPTTSANTNSVPGTYDITKGTLALADNGTFKASNYTMDFVKGTLTITKANGSGSVTMEDWTYGETAKNPVATSATNGTNNVTFEYKVSTAADSTYSTTKPSNAGTYTVRATFAATGNYNAVTATDNFTIAKAENPIAVTTPQNWTEAFAKTDKTKAITSATGAVGNVTYEIQSQKDKNGTTVNYFTLSGTTLTRKANTPVNKSIYTVVIRATAAGNNNYKSGYKDITVNVTVTKANGSGSVTMDDWVYGETAKNPVATSETNGTDNVTFEYKVSTAADSTYSTTKPSNAGTYTVRATFVDATGNYNAVTATDNFTIAKAPNPIQVTTPQNWTEAYATTDKTKAITPATGAQGSVTYTIQSQKDKDGTTVNYFTLSGTTLTRKANTPVNKSIYTVVIRATAAGDSNYNSGYKDITVYVTVTKANGSGSVTMDDWVYGETAKNPVATSETNGTDHVTYKYKVSTAADSTYSTTKPSNAGTYTVQATFASTDNYNAVTATDNFTIAKADNPGRVIAEALTFDTTAQELVYQVDLEGDIYYSVGTELTSSNYTTAGTQTVPSRTNAGTYTVYYYATGNNNYKPKSGHVDATIAKYDISVEGNATIATIGAKTYTGSAITPTPQVTVPIPSGSTTVLVNNTDFTYGYENNINVGTATIKIIAKANSNYTGTKTGTFIIDAKKEIIPTSEDYVGDYDGNEKTFTLEVTTPAGCIIHYKEGNEPLTASNYLVGTTETKPTRTDAGVTTVQWYIHSEDPTYNDLAGSNTITINKVKAPKPTVTAYTGVYDGAGHSVTVTGVSGGTVEYSTDNESWTDSLETVTYTGFTNGANTVYVRVAGDSNHNNSDSVQSSVNINKRSVTVTADNKGKRYGEAMPALTYTIGATGVTGENAGVTGSLATEANASSNVGTYSIKKGTLDLANNGSFDKSNYKMYFVTGTLIITKAPVPTPTVTPYSGTYDGAEHGVRVTGASGGTVQYSTDNSTWQTQPIKYKDFTNGAKTVYVKVVGDENHKNSETVTSSITINKKLITVTADDKNRAYGAANPTFTATIGATGITGETGATSGAPTSSANTTSAPGYYDITVGTLALANNGTFKASNYSMTFTKGTLRIDPVVTFNANGGSGTMTNQVVTYNSATELEENAFTRNGYAFDGWAESASGAKVYSDKEIITITTNKTLFARWNKGAYSIVYDLDGGSVNGNNPETYTVETNTFTLINPTKTGYTFKGWTGSNGNTPQTTVTIPKGSTGNKSYTANWQAINYNVTFDANGGTPNPATITRIYEQPLGTLPTVTRTGYTFDGWYVNLGNNTQTIACYVYLNDHKTYVHTNKQNLNIIINYEDEQVTRRIPTDSNGEVCIEDNGTFATKLKFKIEGSDNWFRIEYSEDEDMVYVKYANENIEDELYFSNSINMKQSSTKNIVISNPFGDRVTAQTTMPANDLSLIAKWKSNLDTEYTVNHYVHDLGTNTYTLDSTDNKEGETNSTLELSDLTKNIAGFTYEEGFANTGNTTKPTSGAVTETTILPNGSRVINLYYRRNKLYVKYNVDGGTLEGNLDLYEVQNSIVKRKDTSLPVAWNNPTAEWVGVYGGTVNAILDANTYTTDNKGLEDYNDSSYINITKTDNKAVSVHKAWKAGNGAVYSQLKNNYTAVDFANMADENLANGDVTITLYVNWVTAIYKVNYVADNGIDVFYTDTLADAVAYSEPPDASVNLAEEDIIGGISQTGGSTITLLVNNHTDSSTVNVSKKVTFKPNSYKLTRTQQILIEGANSEFTIYGGGEVYLAQPSETTIPVAKQRLIFVGSNGKFVKYGSSILRSYTKVIDTWGVKDDDNRGAIVELQGGYLESITNQCISLRRAGNATITNSYVTTRTNLENAIRVDDPGTVNVTIGGTAKVGNGTDLAEHSGTKASTIGFASKGTLKLQNSAMVYAGAFGYNAIAMNASGTNNTATLYCADNSCVFAANFYQDDDQGLTVGRCIGARQGVTVTFSGNKFYAASKYVVVWGDGNGNSADGTLHVYGGTFFSTAKQKFLKNGTASYTGTAGSKTIQIMSAYNTNEDYLTTTGYIYTK